MVLQNPHRVRPVEVAAMPVRAIDAVSAYPMSITVSTPVAVSTSVSGRSGTQVETAPPKRRLPLDDLVSLDIAACTVHLTDADRAREIIAEAARGPRTGERPLAVASINLDHVHHFGEGRRHLGAAASGSASTGGTRVEWFNLIDGAPIASQVRRIAGMDAPRLAGSDLIAGILDDASAANLSVAIVGGAPELAPLLSERLAADWPGIRFAGQWAPDRADLVDPERAGRMAAEIRAAGADIVIVCLGKPRQEEWIDSYGVATGASVLLAFGAVVDFLAGRVSRAPSWISAAGGEWMWRLMLEPRRLARRYLIEGPPAYLAVRRSPGPRRA